MIHTIDSSSGNELNKQAVVSKALFSAADYLDISDSELSQIVNVSKATLSRARKAGLTNKTAYDLAIYFIRCYRSLAAICGSDHQVMKDWLRSQNHAIGQKPIDAIKHIAGLVHVMDYLDMRRAVI